MRKQDAEAECSPSEATPTSSLSLFPVLVYSHGLGAMSMTYSAICCDLASHGYVVASVEHRLVYTRSLRNNVCYVLLLCLESYTVSV